MKFIKNNLKTLLAFVAFIILAIILLFALVITPANREQQRIAEEKLAELRKAVAFDNCEEQAWESYDLSWENNCSALNRVENCMLPIHLADTLDNAKEKAIDRCVAIYK